MANAFKIKQAEQKMETARSDLIHATRGGLQERERAIKDYCTQTGSTREQAKRILESNSSPARNFGRMFGRA